MQYSFINDLYISIVELNSRDQQGKLQLPKNAKNNLFIIIIPKSRHRPIGTMLSIPKTYSNIKNTHIRSQVTGF